MKEKFYKKTWFTVLMLLVLPPIGLILMWINNKNWNKIIKIIITVILGLWTVLMVAVMATPTDTETTPENEETTSHIQVDETTESDKEETSGNGIIVEPVATTENVSETETEKTTAEDKEEKTEKTTEATKKPTTTKKETTTQKPTTTQKQTTTKKQTTTHKPTTTKKPTAVNSVGQKVYRTKSGECYHYENPCGSGKYYEVTLEQALNAGLRACEKCVLH